MTVLGSRKAASKRPVALVFSGDRPSMTTTFHIFFQCWIYKSRLQFQAKEISLGAL